MFKYTGGIAEFIKLLNKGKQVLHEKPIYMEAERDGVAMEIALQYNDAYSETVFSFANNINTVDGGTHLSGFRTSLTRTINWAGQQMGLFKDVKENLSGDDVREGLVAVVSVKLPQPQFEGQTKGKLNSDIAGTVQAFVNERLGAFLEQNPPVAKQDHQQGHRRRARPRGRPQGPRSHPPQRAPSTAAASPANSPTAPNASPTAASSTSSRVSPPAAPPSRVATASSRPSFPLKGKILNVEKARYDKMLGHEEIRAMITALGCGIGKDDFDVTKLRYGKLILMTDADVDGSHIRTLLLTFFFRHMTELIQRGHVYIAQPPLFRIKKGKFEQYIKDEREFVQVMVKRASEGMVIRHGVGASAGTVIEGRELTTFMSRLNDYLSFFDKVAKRLRNEDAVRAFAEIFAHEGKDPAHRTDFESPDLLKTMRARLKELERTYQFKHLSEVEFDEEHRLYSVSFTDAQGAIRRIDWTLASAPETRQLLAKQAQLGDQLIGPFHVEYAAKQPVTVASGATPTQAELDEADEVQQEEGVNDLIAAAPGTVAEAKPGKRAGRAAQDPVERRTPRELFDYVIEQGRKEYQVQRYKGLGEMTAPQLWETTMDPDRRTLLQVKLEDIAGCEEIFTTLMGEDVEARRKFIEENALDVKNLDI